MIELCDSSSIQSVLIMFKNTSYSVLGASSTAGQPSVWLLEIDPILLIPTTYSSCAHKQFEAER